MIVKLKLENYKAQHNSILGNIRDANKELENIKESQRIELTKLQDLKDSIQEHTRELELTQERYVELNTVSSNLKKRIDCEKNTLTNTHRLIEAKKKEYREQVERYGKKLADISDKTKQLKEEKEYLEKDIQILNETINLSDERSKKLIQSIKDLKSELKDIVEKSDDKSNEFRKVNEIFNKTISDIEEKISEEKEKIKKPLELLKLREFELSQKERNLNTLIRRFRRHFKKQFPHQELKL